MMPPKNALEFFAVGTPKRTRRKEIVEAAGVKPEPPASKSVEVMGSPTEKPAERARKCKRVHFADDLVDSRPKTDCRKGCSKEKICACECKVCNSRDKENGKAKSVRENAKTETNRTENTHDSAGKKGDKLGKQKVQQKASKQQSDNQAANNQGANTTDNNKAVFPPTETQNKSNQALHRGIAQSVAFSRFVRRNMSRLIQPSRSEVIIREDVIECPTDPTPNAFFDARLGLLRVYHGSRFGNPFGTLAPLDPGTASIPIGSRMPMGGWPGMGGIGVTMGATAPPAMYGGWNPQMSGQNDGSGGFHARTGQPPTASPRNSPLEDTGGSAPPGGRGWRGGQPEYGPGPNRSHSPQWGNRSSAKDNGNRNISGGGSNDGWGGHNCSPNHYGGRNDPSGWNGNSGEYGGNSNMNSGENRNGSGNGNAWNTSGNQNDASNGWSTLPGAFPDDDQPGNANTNSNSWRRHDPQSTRATSPNQGTGSHNSWAAQGGSGPILSSHHTPAPAPNHHSHNYGNHPSPDYGRLHHNSSGDNRSRNYSDYGYGTGTGAGAGAGTGAGAGRSSVQSEPGDGWGVPLQQASWADAGAAASTQMWGGLGENNVAPRGDNGGDGGDGGGGDTW